MPLVFEMRSRKPTGFFYDVHYNYDVLKSAGSSFNLESDFLK